MEVAPIQRVRGGLSAWSPALWAGAILCAACGQAPVAVEAVRLESIRPVEGEGVYLNEEIVLTFSQAIDPSSVASTSLRIVDDAGREAEGRWEVVGRQARFAPRPVLSGTLTDGGYLPGTVYSVDLGGFPRLDGLRGLKGEPLDRSWRWSFSTAEVGPGRRGFVFDDASPGTGAHVSLSNARPLHPGEALVLECNEPLDPSSLREEEFRIERVESGAAAFTCRVKARFLANHPEGSRGPLEPCAVIEFMPTERLEPGSYLLLGSGVTLTDYGGNPVWPAGLGRQPHAFGVRRPPPSGAGELESQAHYQLSFLDRTEFLSVAVPGTDGLAHWSDGGVLSVRFPKAAGEGAHGALDLRGLEDRHDLQATTLSVAKGAQVDLGAGPGLRVLRAQGRVHIAGHLGRRISQTDEPRPGPAIPGHPYVDGESLSQWLERARAEDWPWTVLIAGGDLVIDGDLVVNTPLLLVAGGWIRVEGRVDQPPGQLWLLSEGGGLRMDPTATVPDLVIEAPDGNPLKQTLHLAAVSAPLPARVISYRWLEPLVGGRQGAGRYEVSYLPATGPVERGRAVKHPRLLEGEGPVRVLLELFVTPGPLWDPPSLDFVTLRWATDR
ncbi:MAG TPA: Ig-like domain-containing protein [Planctomycetota bacterium]|nr:Ig-like domain-containing protein [Planctomycetota bacterium]